MDLYGSEVTSAAVYKYIPVYLVSGDDVIKPDTGGSLAGGTCYVLPPVVPDDVASVCKVEPYVNSTLVVAFRHQVLEMVVFDDHVVAFEPQGR